MNKNMFKKIICFVIALMMVMPNLPGSMASAASIKGGENLSVDKTAYKVEGETDKDFWIQFDINGEDTTIEPIPLDVVLVLDRSGSMEGNNRIGNLKKAANSFIDKVLNNNTNNRVSILTFSDGNDGYTETPFSKNATTLKKAVNDMTAKGDTNTGEAFKRAKNLLDSANENSKKALVLFTDGAPAPRGDEVHYSYSKSATVQARAIQAEYSDMPMYCVYWDPNVGSGEKFYLDDEIPNIDVENIGSNFYKEKTWNKTLDREEHWFFGTYYEHYLRINNSFILNTLLPTFVSKPEYLIKASTELTQLESVFDGIAGSILSFATDVTLTDLVKKENFNLNISTSGSVQFRSKVASGTNTNAWETVTSNSTQPIYYTVGADSNADTEDIQMTFDKISQPGIEVRFKIKLEDGVFSSRTASENAPDLDTNESAKITYTDAIDKVHSNKNIPIFPKVFVPNPNVTAKIVKVDEDGKPLEGARFTVDKQGSGTSRVAEGPANGGVGKNEFSFTIDTTNSSAYIIKETAPEGYVKSDDFKVQLKSDGIRLIDDLSNVTVDNNSMSIIVKNEKDSSKWHTVRYLPGDQGTFTIQEYNDLLQGTSTPAFVGEKTGNEGYTFKEWNPVVTNTVTGSVDYVAQWEKDTSKWHTVRYLPGDQGTFTIQEYNDLLQGTSTPAFVGEKTGNEGYTFKEWNPAVTNTVTGSVDYVAQWEKDSSKWHTVIYLPGEEGTFTIQEYNDLLQGTSTPSFVGEKTGNEGYTFKEWNPAVTNTVTGSVDYVAQWEKDSSKWHTVTFEAGANGSITGTTFYDDILTGTVWGTAIASVPTHEAEPGYKFDGWTPTPFATTITEDLVYTANFVINSEITIKLNIHKYWFDRETQLPQLMSLSTASSSRPDSITVYLLNEDEERVSTAVVSPDEYGEWFGSFIVPMYDSNNELIDYSNYTIEEDVPDNYIYEFENYNYVYGYDGFQLYNIEVLDVPVSKVWDGPVGDEVTIVLLDSSGKPTDYTLTLNEDNNWTDSFKLPLYEIGDGFWSIYYGYYTVEEISVDGYSSEVTGDVYEGGFVVTNTANSVNYTVNYLELGTNLPVADSVTKSGIYGSEVTENAIDVDGYNKVGLSVRTIHLGNGKNEINFYYSKHDVVDGTDYHDVVWKYETGYNTNAYTDKYELSGKGAPETIQYYVDLHYDPGYTYTTYKSWTEDKEVEVIVDVTSGSAITGSAVTGTAIKVDTTTFIELSYDRNYTGGGGTRRPVVIEDPEVPLADLEKIDHFAYVIGYPDGEVKPLNNITREEVAMIFYRLLTDQSRDEWLSDVNPFTDLEGHDWSNRAISTLYNAGIIKGYPDGTFGPSDPISRAEFATIAAKFDNLELQNITKFTDISGHWAEKYVTSSEIKGWIKGYPDNTFKPEQDITRAEAMTLINNVLERKVPEENIHPDAMFWPDMVSDDWYYEAVMEATNSHDYIYEEEDGDELWTGMKLNKVWP